MQANRYRLQIPVPLKLRYVHTGDGGAPARRRGKCDGQINALAAMSFSARHEYHYTEGAVDQDAMLQVRRRSGVRTYLCR